MAKNTIPEIRIENAHILFRNFGGAPTKYNPKGGKRTFCVILDPSDAKMLAKQGWNIKYLDARPEDGYDEPTPFLSVNVSFDNYPPSVNFISGNTMTQLDESTVGIIDDTDIETVDVCIRPYSYDVNGNQGVAAYLKTLYVVAKVDDFAKKYARFNQPFAGNDEVPFA